MNEKGFSFSHMKISNVKGMRISSSKKKKQENKKGEGTDIKDLDNAKNINEVFGKDEKKVSTLFHAVKLVKTYHLRNVEDEKMEQLRLKQAMNLNAKGFYLDNAEDMCRIEWQEETERKIRMRDMLRRQNELLRVIGGVD